MRKYPIIRLNDFAVFAFPRNEAQSVVVIPDLSQEALVRGKTDANVFRGIAFRNLQRLIRTAIIYKNVFPILIRLCEHTLDTLGQISVGVVERCYHAY
jgi:hypothetical protein